MQINVKAVTEFDLGTDGQTVTLYVLDAAGAPVSLNFRVAELGTLAMTLPTLIDAAIGRQFGDTSCRFTYPMESWLLEQAADPSVVILTLRTTDGFGVSFSMPRTKAGELSASISVGVRKEPAAVAH